MLKCGQGLIYQTEISLGFHGFAVVSHIRSCYFNESSIECLKSCWSTVVWMEGILFAVYQAHQ